MPTATCSEAGLCRKYGLSILMDENQGESIRMQIVKVS